MKYNELQQLAIDSTAPKVLVTAPAGSGKTSTLVGAIQKYAEENPFDRIVAITFTKKAALELQSRTFGLKVDSSTIHSWSLKELNRLGVKHKFKVSILQDDQIQEILQVLSRKCGYYSMNFYLLFAYVMGNYNIDVAQSTKMKYEKVLKTFQQTIEKSLLPDFKATFPKDLIFTGNWSEDSAISASNKALASRAKMVISLGYMSSVYLVDKKNFLQ